ncbi:hypothetical protein A3D81_00160 [Candidatus Curtissbacteria bacterium RIFCSPHIGHO2_02_FULL_40_17]|uniref:Uncharacterized protein n=2 Tax=Candidatus Curtissiibacteriota TaxID=1752717 RepID=A0A1F5GHB4_9BACT|nr:MAG: hypothetical protein A3D81_00160 [Candidatus Curtissbacteria bacterium RIFCSPHIGHO2_02_FULL_40_17]OGE07875.1 MAG: hypothetical protein A3I53_04290 [Candidatus Curtissbacteria bacterium RIFCSPLOWO2_02_FULL_40_13b]
MNFYHNLITDKSWKLLIALRKKYQFILIGGWAVFLYTKALKSKDVDLVVEFDQLDKLREEFAVSKNDRLKKYEAKLEGLDIDIYLPFYSNLGIPAEDIKKFAVNLEGFRVPEKEILAILKQKALISRANTVKGRKDLIDLVSLFVLSDFDWDKYHQIISQYQLSDYLQFTGEILTKTTKIEELDLNIHKIAKFKKQILANLQ